MKVLIFFCRLELFPQLGEQWRGVSGELEDNSAHPQSSTALSVIFILAVPLAFTIEGFHGRCLGFIFFWVIYTFGLCTTRGIPLFWDLGLVIFGRKRKSNRLIDLNRFKSKIYLLICMQSRTTHHSLRSLTEVTTYCTILLGLFRPDPKRQSSFCVAASRTSKLPLRAFSIVSPSLHAPSPSAWSRLYTISSTFRLPVASDSPPLQTGHSPRFLRLPDLKISPRRAFKPPASL